MIRNIWLGLLVSLAALTAASMPAAAQQQQRPNIVVIMGDDIGIWNIGAYHRGMMAGRTPNLDQIAAEGMLTTTPRRAARRDAPTSSPASCRSAPA
jgi:arylsulfatase